MQEEDNTLTLELIEKYIFYLWEQERAENTVKKYSHDIKAFYRWLDGRPVTKPVLMEWKEHLISSYAPASVNSMLAAVNGFLQFTDWKGLSVKPLRIQKSLFCDESKELSEKEYIRLVEAARKEGNERLLLILQTICATGIRVSELKFITAEAVQTGKTKISNKGKQRTVFLPGKLCSLLKRYLQKERRTKGAVFVTRTGKPVDRSNIWRDMKKLCKGAEIEPSKVFPHNLRHLFARTYYAFEKDIARLADILGHSSINTTRIYTMESGKIHARQIDRLGLVIT